MAAAWSEAGYSISHDPPPPPLPTDEVAAKSDDLNKKEMVDYIMNISMVSQRLDECLKSRLRLDDFYTTLELPLA